MFVLRTLILFVEFLLGFLCILHFFSLLTGFTQEDVKQKILENIQKKKHVIDGSPSRLYASIGSLDSEGEQNRENNQNQLNQGQSAPHRPKQALPKTRMEARVKHLSLDDPLTKTPNAGHSAMPPNSVQSKRENFSQQKNNNARVGAFNARDTTAKETSLNLTSLTTGAQHQATQPSHSEPIPHASSSSHVHSSPSGVLSSLSPRFLHREKTERDKESISMYLKRDQIFLTSVVGTCDLEFVSYVPFSFTSFCRPFLSPVF